MVMTDYKQAIIENNYQNKIIYNNREYFSTEEFFTKTFPNFNFLRPIKNNTIKKLSNTHIKQQTMFDEEDIETVHTFIKLSEIENISIIQLNNFSQEFKIIVQIFICTVEISNDLNKKFSIILSIDKKSINELIDFCSFIKSNTQYNTDKIFKSTYNIYKDLNSKYNDGIKTFKNLLSDNRIKKSDIIEEINLVNKKLYDLNNLSNTNKNILENLKNEDK